MTEIIRRSVPTTTMSSQLYGTLAVQAADRLGVPVDPSGPRRIELGTFLASVPVPVSSSTRARVDRRYIQRG